MSVPPLFEVVITAIVVRDHTFLVERRALSKQRFPGKWSVPGGKLEPNDFLSLPKDTEHYWYNVLERTLKREVQEEVGIDIANVRYLTSLARVHEDGTPSLVISCLADYAGGEIRLEAEELDRAVWVSLGEAKECDLIDGIYDELAMADAALHGRSVGAWQRTPPEPSGSCETRSSEH